MNMYQPPARYSVPADIAEVEDVIKRSRFIGTAGLAATVEDAHDFVNHVRGRFPDAGHHAWGYLVGIGIGSAADRGMSDDGEPNGTAGSPILSRIDGSGLGDLVVVVTRYWGGIKLGKGGLVRAYGGTAGQAIRALAVAEKVSKTTLHLDAVHYSHYGPLRGLIESCGGTVTNEAFGEAINLDLEIPLDQLQTFAKTAADMTAGAILIDTTSEK